MLSGETQSSKSVEDLVGQVEVLMSLKSKQAVEGNPLLSYHKQEVLIVLADLYALKMTKDLMSESELTSDCLVCCMYLQSVTDAQMIDHLNVFNRARAVHTVLQVMKLFGVHGLDAKYYKRFRKVWTLSVLSDMRREAQMNQMSGVVEDVNNLMRQLHRSEGGDVSIDN